MTDRDVKALVARIEDDRDKFDNALDDELKNKILRDSTGEVDVKRFLNNFQERHRPSRGEPQAGIRRQL